MQEGLRWEGTDERSREEDEFDWRGMLSADEEEDEVFDDDEDEDRRDVPGSGDDRGGKAEF